MTVKIDQAFIADFIAQGFGLPIAHENEAYTPTAGVEYAELKVFQNAVSPLGLSDTDETTGVYQFTLRFPEGAGAMPAKTQAETIFAAYPVGRILTYSGQQVTITGRERFDATPEAGWFKVVGRIYYRAHLPR